MRSRAIALAVCGAALSACTGIPSMPSFNMPSVSMPSFNIPGFNSSGTPVRVESNPGRRRSQHRQRCALQNALHVVRTLEQRHVQRNRLAHGLSAADDPGPYCDRAGKLGLGRCRDWFRFHDDDRPGSCRRRAHAGPRKRRACRRAQEAARREHQAGEEARGRGCGACGTSRRATRARRPADAVGAALRSIRSAARATAGRVPVRQIKSLSLALCRKCRSTPLA